MSAPASPSFGLSRRSEFDSYQAIGSRTHQQDSCLVASIKVDFPFKSSGEFLREFVATTQKSAVESGHKFSGSTFCAAAFNARDGEATIANLGDSRAFLLVRNNLTYEQYAISLSEDHNFFSERVSAEREGLGIPAAQMAVDRSRRDTLLAYIGSDTSVKNQKTDPDIFSFNFSEVISEIFSEEEGEFVPLKLILCSDGILHAMKSDYDLKIAADGSRRFVANETDKESIAKIYEKNPEISAKGIVDRAKSVGCGDNMSVIIFDCSSRAASERNLVGVVCDGHGEKHQELNTSSFVVNSLQVRSEFVDKVLYKELSSDKRAPRAVAVVREPAATQLFGGFSSSRVLSFT